MLGGWVKPLPRAMHHSVAWIRYIYMVGSLTIYLITMRSSLQLILQKCTEAEAGAGGDCGQNICQGPDGVVELHQTVWLFVAAAIAWPLLLLRNLEDVAITSYLGVLTIAVVNVVIIVRSSYEIAHPSHDHDDATHVASETDFVSFINGVTNIAFAYG